EQWHVGRFASRGGPPAMTDESGGSVHFHRANAAAALPQLAAGKVTAVAVGGAQRMPQLPQVPTMKEAGIAGFDTDQWIGLLAPAATPAAVIDRLNQATGKALQDPKVREALTAAGITAADPDRKSTRLNSSHVK